MEAYKHKYIKAHQIITRVVDGDGLFVIDMFGKNETEIRFLGIDAPEIKRSKKLKQDERETHLPGQLLLEMGFASKHFLSSIVSIGEWVTLVMEREHSFDIYGRTLAYVLLKDGTCLNEMMISASYAKPYEKYWCKALSEYQILNSFARNNGRGHYQKVERF
jgi:micrococcal nuclease